MSTYESAFCNNTTDLEFVVPDISQYDRKTTIAGFLPHGNNVFKAGNTGTIDTLFRDSFELGDAEANVAALTEDGEWFYDSDTDTTYLYSSNNPLTHHIVEGGRDYATLKTQAINRAAEFIRSYIDKPVYKRKGTGVQSPTARDYEDVLVRSNALLAASFLLNPYDPERAADIERIAYDKEEQTGYLDRIKNGEIRLWHEIDKRRQSGVVREVTYGGSSTGYIIDVKGRADGYDLIKVIISTAGTFAAGTASGVKYTSYIGDTTGLKMQTSVSAEIINGTYQNIGRGLSAKFSAGVYSANDEWEVEAVPYHEYVETQTPIKNAQAERAAVL